MHEVFKEILDLKSIDASIIGSGGEYTIRGRLPISNLADDSRIPIGSMMFTEEGLVGIISVDPNDYISKKDAVAAKEASDALHMIFGKYKTEKKRS
jgi:hypothetical protein